MRYKIYILSNFAKEFKKLNKKYPSLKEDFSNLTTEVQKKSGLGNHLFNGVHKIRMKITSKGRGKSSGARIIAQYKYQDGIVYMIAIYDKSERVSISDEDIIAILKELE